MLWNILYLVLVTIEEQFTARANETHRIVDTGLKWLEVVTKQK